MVGWPMVVKTSSYTIAVGFSKRKHNHPSSNFVFMDVGGADGELMAFIYSCEWPIL